MRQRSRVDFPLDDARRTVNLSGKPRAFDHPFLLWDKLKKNRTEAN